MRTFLRVLHICSRVELTADDVDLKYHLEKIAQQQKQCVSYNKLALEKLDFSINLIRVSRQPEPSLSLAANTPATPVVFEYFSVFEVNTSLPSPEDQSILPIRKDLFAASSSKNFAM